MNVPFWICDESACKYPGLPVVIFSDNVGGEDMSAEIVEKWRLIISMSTCCVEDGSNSALRCGVVSGGLPRYVIFDHKSFFTSTGTNKRYKLDAKLWLSGETRYRCRMLPFQASSAVIDCSELSKYQEMNSLVMLRTR
jgi:hypothetical protein